MIARKPRGTPFGYILSLCTAFLLTASAAFATSTADVGVTKTNNTGGTAAGGQTVTYTITLHNFGPNGANKITLSDTLDGNLTNISAIATVPDKCTVVAQTVSCSVEGIGNGSNDTLTITATVSPSTPVDTVITNCASITGSSSNDPNSSNNTGCDGAGFTVVQSADLSVTKTQTSPAPGGTVPGLESITYHISATNNGPSDASNVVVGDSFSVGSAAFGSVDNVTGGLDCSTFTALPGQCTIATLTNGSSVSFDLTVTAPNDGTTSITNTATVSSDTNDGNTANNTSSVTTAICQSVDLSLTKACLSVCPPGDSITKIPVTCPAPVTEIGGGTDYQYELVATNNDPSVAATNVTITDVLPAGVTYVSNDGGCDTSLLPTVTCNVGSIVAGDSSVPVHIRVTAVDSGPINNQASVAADQCDRNTEDNTASCSVTVDTNNMPTALEADRESSSTDTDCITTDPISTSSDVNRVFEPGEEVRIDPAWHNTLSNPDPDTTGTADTPTSPSGGTLTIEDCSADYGAIPANSDSDCNSATGDCYQMKVTENVAGVRPHLADHPRHWDTTFKETLSSGETHTYKLHIGDTFPDVPRSDPFYRFIETILHNRITVGCGNGDFFCPSDPVIRAQIAAFVARSLAGNDTLVPTSSGDYNCVTGPSQFTDVPTTNGFCKHINYLKDVKVVSGCTPTTFCPELAANRGAVAVVIARAAEVKLGNTADPDGSIPLFGNDTTGARAYNCDSSDHLNSVTSVNIPAGTPPFPDVPSSGDVCKSVGLLYAAHVVDGSDPGHFFPDSNIQRDQAAKILTHEFVNLPLYGP